MSIVNEFHSGKIWTHRYTDMMVCGLNFKGVSCVINYDFPVNMISYIERITKANFSVNES
jgi:ATP-dependent RNA helicase DDX52/ROK1